LALVLAVACLLALLALRHRQMSSGSPTRIDEGGANRETPLPEGKVTASARRSVQAVPPRFAPRFQPGALNAFMAQVRAPHARTPDSYYEAERRNADWAKPMEERITLRFAPEKLKPIGLVGMALDGVECRSSSCKLDISWSEADLKVASQSDQAALFGVPRSSSLVKKRSTRRSTRLRWRR
jgi:hypothetical protein